MQSILSQPSLRIDSLGCYYEVFVREMLLLERAFYKQQDSQFINLKS